MATAIDHIQRALGSSLLSLATDEEGQGLVEYGLILLFVAVVAVLALTFLGTGLSNTLSDIANAL